MAHYLEAPYFFSLVPKKKLTTKPTLKSLQLHFLCRLKLFNTAIEDFKRIVLKLWDQMDHSPNIAITKEGSVPIGGVGAWYRNTHESPIPNNSHALPSREASEIVGDAKSYYNNGSNNQSKMDAKQESTAYSSKYKFSNIPSVTSNISTEISGNLLNERLVQNSNKSDMVNSDHQGAGSLFTTATANSNIAQASNLPNGSSSFESQSLASEGGSTQHSIGNDLQKSSSQSSGAAEPALSWQIPPSALTPKKVKHEKVEKMEQRISENEFDVEAWINLLNELQTKAEVEKVRETFERFLKLFPSASRQWIQYAEFELKHNNYEQVEEIFKRCLRPVLSVDLWKYYLNYVRRKNVGEKTTAPIASFARKTIEQAYEFVLNHIGIDMVSGSLWGDYLFFLKTLEATSLWEEQQKMDQMRKAFKTAICIPIHNVEHIWKEYDIFENGLNKVTAKKFLQERSASYMTARTALRELRGFMEEINRNVIPVPPKWERAELQQLDAWKRWIAWEKTNPLAFEDRTQLAQRVIYAYKQAMMYMRHYPEIWFEASNYWVELGKEEDAANLLKSAMECLPTSFLVHFAYAELQEHRKLYPQARESLETLIKNLTGQIQCIEQSAKDEIELLMRQSVESSPEESGGQIPIQLDGEMREQLRIREKEREKDRGRIEERKQRQVEEIACGCSMVWIMLMRYARREEGVEVARNIFTKARKFPYLTYHVFVSAALMEYYFTKDPKIAGKIFDLGHKTFGDNSEYVIQYLDFLIGLNDNQNALAVFQKTLKGMPPEKAKIIWDKYSHYLSHFADLETLRKLDEKRAKKYPDETPLGRFAQRCSYLNINIISQREIGAKPGPPDRSVSPPEANRPTKAHEEEQDFHAAKRALLNSVQPEKYPRPDFRQWVQYKPTPEQLRRPTFPPVNPGQGSIPPVEIVTQPLGFQPTLSIQTTTTKRPSPPPSVPSPPSQGPPQAGPVIWKRGLNGMLLPDAVANFLAALPPVASFPANVVPLNPVDLIEILRTSNIPPPPTMIPNGGMLSMQPLPQHSLQPPQGPQSRENLSRAGSPGRGGPDGRVGFNGLEVRYGDGPSRGYDRGHDNSRGAYSGNNSGPGVGRARQGEFFGKQNRGPQPTAGRGRAHGNNINNNHNIGGDHGSPSHFSMGNPHAGKRRRRDFDGDGEDFQGKSGPGINRAPDYDLFRVRQQKRARDGVMYGGGIGPAGGGDLISTSAGLETWPDAKKKRVNSVYSHSASYKKPKNPKVSIGVIDLSAGSLNMANIGDVGSKFSKSWSSKIESKVSSISSLLDLKNIKNTITKETSYANLDTSVNIDIEDDITPRKMHTCIYVLSQLPKTSLFNILSDNEDLMTLPSPKFAGFKKLHSVRSRVLDKHIFDPVKSFVLDIKIFVLSDKTIDDKLIAIKKISSFTSELSLIKAKEMAISEKILVNINVRKPNSHSDWEVIVKEILIDLPKLAIGSIWLAQLFSNNLLDSYGGKTCFIGHNLVLYVYNKCVVICFDNETSKLAAIDSVLVYKSVNLHWAGLSLICYAKCKQFGYVSDVCLVCLANIYKKKQVSVVHSVSFGGKTWAQIADNSPFHVASLVSSGAGLTLNAKLLIMASNFLNNSGLTDCMAFLKCSMELLSDQVSEILRKLSFVELVPMLFLSCIPFCCYFFYELSFEFEYGLIENATLKLSLSSSKILTTKVGGLKSKMMALEVSVGLVLVKLNSLCSSLGLGINNPVKQSNIICWHKEINNLIFIVTETKLKDKVCPWIMNRFDGIYVFTSGIDSGYLSSDIAIIIDNSLACHVCKVSEVPGQILCVKLFFKNKLSVLILGLYAGASLVVWFSQTVNKSSFVILGSDFNKNKSCKCASFKKYFDLGLVNSLAESAFAKILTWCNSHGVVKTINYVFVSLNLVNVIGNHNVVGVVDYFDTNYAAVSISVSLGGLLDVQLSSLYKQANKDCWKYNIKSADRRKWCSTFDAICFGLVKARKFYHSSKLLEFKHAEEFLIKWAITSKIESFELNKDHIIRSVLEHSFCKVVLDHLVVGDELVLEPDLVRSRVDEIMKNWTRKHGIVSDISDN
ncbi:hypothetical protein G9A89_013659 [Geosiphon pyriformis]|nr:hypothetical protein G9A89_013659 [Geosiphon pyriformis]